MTDILTIRVQDSVVSSASAQFTINVVNPDSITTASLPNGSTGSPYSAPVTVVGGIAPYSGLIIGNSTGANSFNFAGMNITGTPTVAETTLLTIVTFDSLGVPASRQLTLTTVAASPAATPTFSPVAGTYSGTQSVTISCSTPSSSIFYTTNGTTPTTGSTPYTTPITVAVSETLKAIATAPGFGQSLVGSAAYVITGGGTLTLAADGGLPAPPAAVGIPYELGISVTNSANLISWTVLSPVITSSFINQSNTRTIFSWPNPTPLGAISITIQATDTVTSNTGTIVLSI